MAEFSTRLACLSRVQGLLSRSDREPITIGALVRMELDAVAPGGSSSRTTVEGPEVRLRKRSVQMLALAIHELATNAQKHGALASDDGWLAVRWELDRIASGRAFLSIEWLETGIEQRLDRTAPRRCGYGRTLIERGLPYALSARTSFELSEHSFRCTIMLPLDEERSGETGG
jgi:two-component sensor histidine kinase